MGKRKLVAWMRVSKSQLNVRADSLPQTAFCNRRISDRNKATGSRHKKPISVIEAKQQCVSQALSQCQSFSKPASVFRWCEIKSKQEMAQLNARMVTKSTSLIKINEEIFIFVGGDGKSHDLAIRVA